MQRTLIWDLPTRLFHWTLAGSFALAWLTSEGDQWLPIHVFLGYLMLGLVGFRVFWGFAGSHFSRFASFWFGPRAAISYLKQVASHKAARHVGHNPTGSLAIYILLALTVVVGCTGFLTLGGEEQQGLAAGWLSFSQIKLLKQVHDASATLMLLVVFGHIAGVVIESLVHKENLARAMLTGIKLAEPGTPKTYPRPVVAMLMLVAMLGFGVWWFAYAIDRNIGKQLPDDKQWRDECGSCHGAYYPALLPARSWEKMMAEQSQHFGTDLALDATTTANVLKFMLDNSADRHLTEAAFKIDQSVPQNASPQRITETPYWVKKHREIAASDWALPLVKSKGNCAACHSDADQGTFEDGAMQIPTATRSAAAPVPAASRP